MDTIVAQADPYGVSNAYTGNKNLFDGWLGPLPNTGRTDPYEARAVDKWNMPDGYVGQNQYLGQTILDLLFLNNNFIVQRILPLRETNQITLVWEQFEAMAHMLDTTPYQTPAHLLTQRRSIRRARLVHRNIMVEFEQNFLQTPMGRVSFMAAMRQIENSVVQTAVIEGVRSLLNCHRYQEQFRQEHMGISVIDIQDALKRDRENFAIVQKVKNGMTKLDLDISKTMASYGGIANAYLVPEEISIYCQSVPSTATDYDKAGPMGPARINGTGPNYAGAAGTAKNVEPTYLVRSNDTYVVKDLRVEGVSREDAELLTRVRQIGEFMTMLYDPQMDPTTYRSKNRSILAYDEDIDDMRELSIQDTINNCGLFDENGQLLPINYNDPNTSGLERQQDMFVQYQTRSRIPYITSYLFQMSPEYLSTNVIVNAAKTLQRAAGVMANVGAIIGSDNLIGGDVDNLNLGIPLVRPVPQAELGPNPNRMNEQIQFDSALLKAMVAGGPASKQVDLNEIAAQVNVPAVVRSERIRDKIGQYITEKVKGNKIPDIEKLEVWHANLVKKYQEKIAAIPVAQPAAQQQQRSSSTRIENFSVFADLLRGAAPQQQQGGQQYLEESAGGLGLADIGQFAWARSTSNEGMQGVIDGKLKEFDLGSETLQRHLTGLSGQTPEVIEFATALLMMRITKKNLLNLAARDVVVPFNFVLLRPHQQVATKTVIKMQQDGGTGYTFIGMANFQIQHEAGRMLALAHYSTHMRSVVMQPKNAWVQPDVMVVRTEGGAGCKFWNPEAYIARNQVDQDQIELSLICVATPATEREYPSPMDITGRFNTLYAHQTSGNKQYEPLHYSTAARYRALYQFGTGNGSVDDAPITGQRMHNNTICYQGHQQNYNPSTNKHDIIIVNKGHWGKNVYPGVRDEVRNGGRHELQQMNYTTTASNAYYTQ